MNAALAGFQLSTNGFRTVLLDPNPKLISSVQPSMDLGVAQLGIFKTAYENLVCKTVNQKDKLGSTPNAIKLTPLN